MKETIREMANEVQLASIIRKVLTERIDIQYIPDLAFPVAKELLKHYQPKLPEGSVIVSKQIWEEHIEKREKVNKIFEEQVRKETAKEILQELYDQVDEKTPKWVETQIKMKAKQFGVEVEE